ncbi:hypothetical protein CFIO01_08713 [Colletotrichum fioriniae PJ7]|uniref:Uncharacterized protein n=1 Tax=Colletotrichum fioriniae PJ7 TaxID=1445577 RepID=A0A010RA03_9PEZI|nr:hypothetical protein CFIO01_08713 [Colletotrichum fioriniae PJ7]
MLSNSKAAKSPLNSGGRSPGNVPWPMVDVEPLPRLVSWARGVVLVKTCPESSEVEITALPLDFKPRRLAVNVHASPLLMHYSLSVDVRCVGMFVLGIELLTRLHGFSPLHRTRDPLLLTNGLEEGNCLDTIRYFIANQDVQADLTGGIGIVKDLLSKPCIAIERITQGDGPESRSRCFAKCCDIVARVQTRRWCFQLQTHQSPKPEVAKPEALEKFRFHVLLDVTPLVNDSEVSESTSICRGIGAYGQNATSDVNINTPGSRDCVRPTRRDCNSQDRAPLFSIAEEQRFSSLSPAALEQRRVSPTANQFAQEPISTPEATLPLPPEYADLGPSYLKLQPEKHVLADFENFFRTSGLQQIADDLGRTQRHSLNETRNSLTDERLNNASDHCLSLSAQEPDRRDTQTHMTVTKSALYALGALYLYESHNAMSLFTTSRRVAFQEWTSCMGSLTEKPSQVRSPFDTLVAYHLLAEFLKVSQPVGVVQELEICAITNSFYSRLSRFHAPTDQQSVDSDADSTRTFQRSHTIMLCGLIIDGFLLGFSVPTQSDDLQRAFKCSLSSLLPLELASEGGEQSRGHPHIGDVVSLFNVLAHDHDDEADSSASDSESILSTLPPDVHFVLLSFIILRIRQDKDACMLGIASEALSLEHTRLILACLLHLRAVCPLDLNYAADPSRLVASLKAIEPKIEEPLAGSLLQCIEHCLEFLEEPASTGLPHYVRQHASSWGMETVLWVFESAVFLSKWLGKYTAAASSVKDGEF